MFGVEAILVSVVIGPSAIFWWFICTIGFFFFFGLITAELGSTYPEQGEMDICLGQESLGREMGSAHYLVLLVLLADHYRGPDNCRHRGRYS